MKVLNNEYKNETYLKVSQEAQICLAAGLVFLSIRVRISARSESGADS